MLSCVGTTRIMGLPLILVVSAVTLVKLDAHYINGLITEEENENGTGLPFLFWLTNGTLWLNPLSNTLMSDISESNYRGTGCRKAARPDLWGSGEVTNRSTRTNDYLSGSQCCTFVQY